MTKESGLVSPWSASEGLAPIWRNNHFPISNHLKAAHLDATVHHPTLRLFPLDLLTMAAVYKTLSKSAGTTEQKAVGAPRKLKQRVLILSSRGVTYR